MLNKEIIIFYFIKAKFILKIFLLYKKIIIFYFISEKLKFNIFFLNKCHYINIIEYFKSNLKYKLII